MTARRLLFLAIIVIIVVALLVRGRRAAAPEPAVPPPPAPGEFALSSTAFENGGTIPALYTADGANVSPPLAWENVPAGTQSFALIVDDPDAPVGVFKHWLIADISGMARGLPESVAKTGYVTGPRAVQGNNDFRKVGYGGPDPPRGEPHHYHFKLYALDEVLDLSPEFKKMQLETAMRGHILGEAELVGLYGRPREQSPTPAL